MKQLLLYILTGLPVIVSAQDFNMNKIADKFLTDGLKLYSCPYRNAACEMVLSKTETAHKDAEGNVQSTYELYGKEDTVLFLPDHPVYPVQLLAFYHKSFVNYYKPSFTEDGKRYGTTFKKGNLVYVSPTRQPSIIDEFRTGMSYDHLKWYGKWSRDVEETTKQSYVGDKTRALAEMNHYLDVVNTYLETKIAEASTINYAQQIQDFFGGNEVYYMISPFGHSHLSSRLDAFKVIWPQDGSKASFQMHFPFTDGKYHDKQQFLFPVKQNSAYSNMYEYSHENLVVNQGLLVPFEDILLIVSKCGNTTSNSPNGKKYCVLGYITKDLTNQWLSVLMSGRFINMNWVKNVSNEEYYKRWHMNQVLTTSYDYNTDPFIIENFLLKYIPSFIHH